MTSFYDRAAATAGRLLRQYGSLVSVTRRPSGDYNTDTGDAPAAEVTVFSGYGVVSQYPLKMVDGVTVLRDDKRVTIEVNATTVEPVPGDFVTVGATTYSVMHVEAVSPGGRIIVYKMQVRR